MANNIYHLPFKKVNLVDITDATDPRGNNTFLDIKELNRFNDKKSVNDRFDKKFLFQY